MRSQDAGRLREERIRAVDTHFRIVLSWAAWGGDAVCGKLVNEIVGVLPTSSMTCTQAPGPMLPKSGCKSTTVGAGCNCRPAQHWTSSPTRVSLSPCLAEASRMLPRNKSCSLPSCLARASCTLRGVILDQGPRSSVHQSNYWHGPPPKPREGVEVSEGGVPG